MPVIKSAIKKLRKDKKRTAHNNDLRKAVESAVKKAGKETKEFSIIKAANSALDKAVKKGLLHKNKAARVKSRLAKKVKPVLSTKVKTTVKKASKKK